MARLSLSNCTVPKRKVENANAKGINNIVKVRACGSAQCAVHSNTAAAPSVCAAVILGSRKWRFQPERRQTLNRAISTAVRSSRAISDGKDIMPIRKMPNCSSMTPAAAQAAIRTRFIRNSCASRPSNDNFCSWGIARDMGRPAVGGRDKVPKVFAGRGR